MGLWQKIRLEVFCFLDFFRRLHFGRRVGIIWVDKGVREHIRAYKGSFRRLGILQSAKL